MGGNIDDNHHTIWGHRSYCWGAGKRQKKKDIKDTKLFDNKLDPNTVTVHETLTDILQADINAFFNKTKDMRAAAEQAQVNAVKMLNLHEKLENKTKELAPKITPPPPPTAAEEKITPNDADDDAVSGGQKNNEDEPEVAQSSTNKDGKKAQANATNAVDGSCVAALNYFLCFCVYCFFNCGCFQQKHKRGNIAAFTTFAHTHIFEEDLL